MGRPFAFGRPRHGEKPRPIETIEDLLDRVVVCPSGCWLWAGGLSSDDRSERGSGYGRILRPGTRRMMAAHRFVYEKFVGRIPLGCHVDHLCARWGGDRWLARRCVRPEHLEAVTHAVNMERRDEGLQREAMPSLEDDLVNAFD